MSWRNRYTDVITTLLTNEGTTLEDIFDEDDIFNEVKNLSDAIYHESSLLQFLCNDTNLVKLIDYVTTIPPDHFPEEIKVRYPVISCEILSAECQDIENSLFDSEELITKLYGYFAPEKINNSYGTLVIRVLVSLLNSQVIRSIEYLKRNSHVIFDVLKHIGTGVVTEFFAQLISLEDRVEGFGTVDWLNSIQLMEKVIGMLDKNKPYAHENVVSLIAEIMESAGWESSLMITLSNKSCCEKLAEFVFDDELATPTSIKAGLEIFEYMIKLTVNNDKQAAMEFSDDSDEFDGGRPKIDPNTAYTELPPHIFILLDSLPKIIEILVNPPEEKSIVTQTGEARAALGPHRLKVLHLLEALSMLMYNFVDKKLIDGGVIDCALDTMAQFERNNFAHQLVKEIVVHLCDSLFFIDVLQNSKIVNKVIEAHLKNVKSESESGYRLQNIPFFLEIGEKLLDAGANNQDIQAIIEETPDWNILATALTGRREHYDNFQKSFKIEPGASIMGMENDYSDSDEDRDYEVQLAEVLLTKEQIFLRRDRKR